MTRTATCKKTGEIMSSRDFVCAVRLDDKKESSARCHFDVIFYETCSEDLIKLVSDSLENDTNSYISE